jgi:hypothetical protein
MPSVGDVIAAALALAEAKDDLRDWATTPPVKLLFPAIVCVEFEFSSEYPESIEKDMFAIPLPTEADVVIPIGGFIK